MFNYCGIIKSYKYCKFVGKINDCCFGHQDVGHNTKRYFPLEKKLNLNLIKFLDLISFFKNFFIIFFHVLFIFERERERETTGGRGAES